MTAAEEAVALTNGIRREMEHAFKTMLRIDFDKVDWRDVDTLKGISYSIGDACTKLCVLPEKRNKLP